MKSSAYPPLQIAVKMASSSSIKQNKRQKVQQSSHKQNKRQKTEQSWLDMWEHDEDPVFHFRGVHPSLKTYIGELTGSKEKCRIFVPLCGKSLDMVWLADKGHSVVGVEISQTGITDFFEENSLEYTVEETCVAMAPHGVHVYRAKTKDITIFHCSIFQFCTEVAGGKFDGVWGRGTLTAMSFSGEEDMRKYVDVVSSLLSENGRWMVETFDYEDSKREEVDGHTFVSDKMFHSLFDDKFIVRSLERSKYSKGEVMHNLPGMMTFGADYWVFLHILTWK